ncbi:MAG: homoaconitase, partial [Candidatus Neomarinimicrobiota bacterium]|nr:homoaconitase [Candidatus Neomarinimicrobiota bacterium]
MEAPELVNDMKKEFGNEKLSIKTDLAAIIDFKNSLIKIEEKEYSIAPVGKAAQELILTEGLEKWVKENIK